MDSTTSLFDELDTDGDGLISLTSLREHLCISFSALYPDVDIVVSKLDLVLATLLPANAKHETERHLDLVQFRMLVAQQWGIDEARVENEANFKAALDLNPAAISSSDLAPPAWTARVSAVWHLSRYRYLFILVIVITTCGTSVATFIDYYWNAQARRAFGPGLIVSKTAAGALYPTLLFMIISMSRWLPTFAKHFGFLTTFINWDHSQRFHIIMACLTLLFATIHAVGHLAGSFRQATLADPQDLLPYLHGPDTRRSYASFMRMLPMITGFFAIAILYIMALCGMPAVRRKHFELFQLSHLLMFPFFALMIAHGTDHLLQFPILGIIIGPAVILVTVERIHRHLYRGFLLSHEAVLTVIDSSTVRLQFSSLDLPRLLPFRAGQYVLLQVPEISRWQWHPFSISSCHRRGSSVTGDVDDDGEGNANGNDGDEVTLHIRTIAGSWTRQLRELATSQPYKDGGETPGGEASSISIRIGLDGPFAAPSDVFYRYDRTIIVGAGIGATPCSAIVQDLSQRWKAEMDPWTEKYASKSRNRTRAAKTQLGGTPSWSPAPPPCAATLPSTWASAKLGSTLPGQGQSLAESLGQGTAYITSHPTQHRQESRQKTKHASVQSSIDSIEQRQTKSADDLDKTSEDIKERKASISSRSAPSLCSRALAERPSHPEASTIADPHSTYAAVSIDKDSRLSRFGARRKSSPQASLLAKDKENTPSQKRVDFVWTVRSASDLDWLLPTLTQAASGLPSWIQVNILPFITSSSSLLTSSLGSRSATGELVQSAIDRIVLPIPVVRGKRPDMSAILEAYHTEFVAQASAHDRAGSPSARRGSSGGDMVQKRRRTTRESSVGVLFCGPAALGLQIRDKCTALTSRAVQDGSGYRYVFHSEVF